MELNWVEDFLALVESGNFSRAAASRNISQSNFSRHIQMLEAAVGAQLFNRNSHRIELTPAGEAWWPAAFDIVRRLSNGREHVRRAVSGVASAVRFTATHALAATHFPKLLGALDLLGHLDKGISLQTDDMSACERTMLRGDAHFLLCHHHPSAGGLIKPYSFSWVTVGGDILIPVSAPDPSTGEPLFKLPGGHDNRLPLIAYSESSGIGRILTQARALDVPPAWMQASFSANLAEVLSACVKLGRGIAWLPLSFAENDIASGQLVRAGEPDWDVKIGIRIYRPRTRQIAEAEELWSAIKSLYGSCSAADELSPP